MIDVCFDTLSNSLDLTNLREMFREMEESPNIFINLLMDKFRKEIEEQEERLLSQGYCPKCENEIGYSDAYEWHEVWGARQLCRVPGERSCDYCGWKETD
jgi:hypothetical protein